MEHAEDRRARADDVQLKPALRRHHDVQNGDGLVLEVEREEGEHLRLDLARSEPKAVGTRRTTRRITDRKAPRHARKERDNTTDCFDQPPARLKRWARRR